MTVAMTPAIKGRSIDGVCLCENDLGQVMFTLPIQTLGVQSLYGVQAEATSDAVFNTEGVEALSGEPGML